MFSGTLVYSFLGPNGVCLSVAHPSYLCMMNERSRLLALIYLLENAML